MKTIYLDYAAATPISKEVLAAMQPYFTEDFYNPSATYLAAKKVHADMDMARARVATVLGARPNEIVFTAGGTEANNLALQGILGQFTGGHVVTTAIEHESVRAPLEFYDNFTEVKPRADGTVDATAIAAAVTDKTVLVSVMYANNEIGTVQPLKQISRELEAIRATRAKSGNELPLYFHTDACQAANYLDLSVHRLGVDLMTLNGGKIYGPKQNGVLFVAKHIQLTPLIRGGGQERGLRSGTENVAGCVGFAQALKITQNMRHEETARLQKLQTKFIHLLQEKISNIVINGSLKHRLPNNVHVTIAGQDNERLLFALDEAGVQCAAGSACSASHEESSHVLLALGLTDELARASLRFSLGRATTEKDILQTVDILARLVAQ